jgi:hypothetical protein
MFVLVNNGYVILGPMAWNKVVFENVILEECEKQIALPYIVSGPVVVDDELTILPATYTYDTPIKTSQIHHGPFWSFTDTEAVGNFIIIDKTIEQFKSEVKQLISNKRWADEVKQLKYEIDGVKYTIDTTREGRNIYQSMLMLNNDTYNWKFIEGYVPISKETLQEIVRLIASQVQTAFDNEMTKFAEVDSCETLSELEVLFDRHTRIMMTPEDGNV